MLKCAASEQYGHVRMICGGKGAPRSTGRRDCCRAPDGRFLDKVPGLLEFHLLNNGSEGEDCRSGASSNVEKQGGCSGLLVFGLFISLFIVNVDFVVHCQIVPRETR